MKIYEIGTGYTPIPAKMGAATEIVVEELTRSFINNGTDAKIIDIQAESRGHIELPITEVSVPGIFRKTDVSLGIMHKLKRVVYSVQLANALKKLLKNEKEEVVLHFHNQYNMFFFLKFAPKLRKKVKVAYTVHSYIWGTEWDEIKDTVNKKYFQEVACVKNADIVFVLNDITTKHFVEQLGVPKEKIHMVINGVNTVKYSKLADDTVSVLKKENGLDGKKVLFQVGSVCDRKNQFGTVKMLSGYLAEHRDVVYMFAGGVIAQEYMDSMQAYAKEKGISEQIRYVGELSPGEELNKYYNMADCSVFTSTLESFGLVIIEAISSGTPAIIGKNLMFDLNSGYIMYNDENDFVQAVDKVLYSGNVACDNTEVVEKYNWDNVAKLYYEIFEKNI